MTTVSILDDNTGRAAEIAPWDKLGKDVNINFYRRFESEEELTTAIAASEVIVVMRERTPIGAHLLDQLPALRLIVTTGMANASIDLDAAHQRGVTVVGTASAGTGVIELTWGLILGLTKRIVDQQESLRRGEWQSELAGNLAGRALGLLGFGRLGQGMVPVAQAFSMRVIAWSAHLDVEMAAKLGITAVDRKELFVQSDVLSIHTRLSERTAGLVGSAELATMKPSAILINTSRGPIVDEQALVDALTRKIIAGAGLDTYNEEPLPLGHPLLNAPNTVLVPHLGYASEDNIATMYREAIEDIDAYLSGDPIRVIGVANR